MNENIDDGSLAFLKIKREDGTKHFKVNEITQAQLANKTFWVCDFIQNVKTKFGEERYLVLIKFDKEDSDSMGRKFFTNSKDIKYILDKIEEANAFPRKVTLAPIGKSYIFE